MTQEQKPLRQAQLQLCALCEPALEQLYSLAPPGNGCRIEADSVEILFDRLQQELSGVVSSDRLLFSPPAIQTLMAYTERSGRTGVQSAITDREYLQLQRIERERLYGNPKELEVIKPVWLRLIERLGLCDQIVPELVLASITLIETLCVVFHAAPDQTRRLQRIKERDCLSL